MTNFTARSSFLQKFYGDKFIREFGQGLMSYREPCTSLQQMVAKIALNEKRGMSCLTSIYNYRDTYPILPKKGKDRKYSEYAILDRICFDLDRSLPKKILQASRKAKKQGNVKNVQTAFNLILNDGNWAKPPIEEAKAVAYFIKDAYSKNTFMVFSGAKGAHIYLFFNPVQLQHPAATVKKFQKMLRDYLCLKYVDNQIIGDMGRLLRIPYTVHPDSGLSVVPFALEDNYKEILFNASISHQIENFDLKEYLIPIEHFLEKIDREISYELTQRAYLYMNAKKKGLNYKNEIKGKIFIKNSDDVVKLMKFPCFQSEDYTSDKGHSQRWAIGNILFWCGLPLSEIVKVFKSLVSDFDEKITTQQLNHMLGGDGLPKNVITCKYMKNKGLCKDCGQKFYAKLNLRQEYWDKLNKLVQKD